ERECEARRVTRARDLTALQRSQASGAVTPGVSPETPACHLVPRGSRTSGSYPTASRVWASRLAAPAAKPEVRALDETVQGRGKLDEALRLGELERGLGSTEDGVGCAENARCGVTLEGLDPGLVGLTVQPEPNDDAIAGRPPVVRGIADTHDRHEDSMVVTPEPVARQVRRPEAEVVRVPTWFEDRRCDRPMAYRGGR